MALNLTDVWEDKLAELVTLEVVTPAPAENAVHARLKDIDGAGVAALVSKLKQDSKKYDGFALVFQHATKYKSFEWLQFITRQLVVGDTAKKGNLVTKTNTTSYQLVDSAEEVTDYTFASGSKPTNWDTCWKVDSIIGKPLFREAYEYAISSKHTLTAILDPPSVLLGTIPDQLTRQYYTDLPGDLVAMKEALGPHTGISRAYFSDYLIKKEGGKQRIVARFDFSLTWNPAKGDTKKETFILRSLKTTPTTELLTCHKTTLLREIQPWKAFHDSILP